VHPTILLYLTSTNSCEMMAGIAKYCPKRVLISPWGLELQSHVKVQTNSLPVSVSDMLQGYRPWIRQSCPRTQFEGGKGTDFFWI